MTPSLVGDGHRHELRGEFVTVGRDRRVAAVLIEDELTSRRHALLVRRGRFRWTVIDLNSSNGTFVNGRPIREHPLEPGDVLTFGGVKLVFTQELPAAIETGDCLVHSLGDYREDARVSRTARTIILSPEAPGPRAARSDDVRTLRAFTRILRDPEPTALKEALDLLLDATRADALQLFDLTAGRGSPVRAHRGLLPDGWVPGVPEEATAAALARRSQVGADALLVPAGPPICRMVGPVRTRLAVPLRGPPVAAADEGPIHLVLVALTTLQGPALGSEDLPLLEAAAEILAARLDREDASAGRDSRG